MEGLRIGFVMTCQPTSFYVCWNTSNPSLRPCDNFRTKGATEKGAAEASVLSAGTRYDLPMRKGTLGPDVIDVGTLYQDTGCFTYDPGFTSTASCEV